MSMFWSHVDRRGIDECWPWTGFTDRDGYGVFTTQEAGTYRAHVLAFLLMGGEYIEGPLVLHSCDNPPCCNYARHLCSGTDKMNAIQRAMRRHCPRARITPEDVPAIFAERKAGMTLEEIGKKRGVGEAAIRHILKRRNLAWVKLDGEEDAVDVVRKAE